MTILLKLMAASLMLAGLSSLTSKKDLLTGEYVKKEWFFYAIMAVVLFVFVGLRTNINDTFAYLNAYEGTPATKPALSEIFQSSENRIGGFSFFQRWLKYFGASDQTFLMFFSALTNCIYLWFIRKYTHNIPLSIFLFFTTGVYGFTMAAMRQCVATAFCLIGVDRCIRRKWIPFVLWILFAWWFHPFSIFYIICPFLFFRPWSTKTYQLLMLFLLAAIALRPMIGVVVDTAEVIGKEYTEEELSGAGVNPFRLAVCAVPLVLSFVSRDIIAANEENDADNLIMNLTMINAEIMFVALFGTANYFARLANYFLIFQTLSLPWLFKLFSKKSKTVLTVFAVACYMMYYYYECVIAHGAFDDRLQSVPLFEYLQTLF